MTDYREQFEVVWSGGPLLPPRETPPDPLWDTIRALYADCFGEVSEVTYATKVTKTARVYNKKHPSFWIEKSQGGGGGGSAALRHRVPAAERSTDPAGPEPAGGPAGGVSTDSHSQKGTD